jgi:hypothetical protein
MTNVKIKNLGNRIGDISDLPDSLRKELKILNETTTEGKIADVIDNVYDRIATIDEILVGIYRHHNVTQKRHLLANKLYRMAKEGRIHSIKGKKGVYTTDKELAARYAA